MNRERKETNLHSAFIEACDSHLYGGRIRDRVDLPLDTTLPFGSQRGLDPLLYLCQSEVYPTSSLSELFRSQQPEHFMYVQYTDGLTTHRQGIKINKNRFPTPTLLRRWHDATSSASYWNYYPHLSPTNLQLIRQLQRSRFVARLILRVCPYHFLAIRMALFCWARFFHSRTQSYGLPLRR